MFVVHMLHYQHYIISILILIAALTSSGAAVEGGSGFWMVFNESKDYLFFSVDKNIFGL